MLVLIGHYSVGGAVIWGFTPPPFGVLNPGFYGVEMFFALSGYLIGNILLDIAERSFNLDLLWRFWVRRWLRTIPCYLIALAISVFVALLTSDNNYAILQFLTLTQNFLTQFKLEFFSVSWSLTVEEWFYILFPLVLFGTLAVLPRRGAIVAIIVFLIVPAMLRYIGWRWFALDWSAGLRKMVPMQLDAIAYGTLAAYLTRGISLSARTSTACCIGGAIILPSAAWLPLISKQLVSSDIWISNGAFVTSALGSALLVVASTRLKAANVAFKAPVMYLSKHAYTLYLLHVQVFGLTAYALLFAGAYGLTPILGPIAGFAVSALLTRFVEIPIMNMRPKQFDGSQAADPGPEFVQSAS
ncbi:acyltransferase [Mesorhizobium sp. AR07]|uniref:acyltransferase family protein n=1 Tax=Mesorhizobium sp. AR07 TaxID=2865838 RepID=UPI0021600C5E|nr:acyltransferase [Mesorhizobium sp. AR07]UVK45698.1 acyltransferase [Mesorhizobium sp. AR07]